MKKLHLFIFLFIALLQCLSHLSSAQYVPFPKGKAVWRNYENLNWINEPKLAIWYYQPGTDTLISGKSYKKIYKVSKLDPKAPNDTIYAVAIREDETAQKVWVVPSGTSEEQLLYDFNLKLGDKISGWYNIDKPLNPDSYYEVTLVQDGSTYLQLGKIPRRLFVLKGYNLPRGFDPGGKLVSGIGFYSGLLSNPSNVINYGYERELCFSDEEKDPRAACYNEPDIRVAISAEAKNNKTIILYPNPANVQLNIQSVQAFTKFVIYHCTGQKVLETSATESIDVSSLIDGLYLLEAIDSKGSRVIQKWEKR